ncbi:TauD/TfdA family dioxygenase [Baekduia sp. Peel2402]|uniref:TauD/TfdA family dioxygenase n=1 Tax=Baekduia sp. Peel2402 TaxID=3458296 RepID=UPI00403E8D06
MQIGSLDGPPDPPEVLSLLEQYGAVRIASFSRDESGIDLQRLATSLDTPSAEDFTVSCTAPLVTRVESLADPKLDTEGLPIKSTSAVEFACHTDEFYLPEPAKIVMLQCVRPDPHGGGDTILSALPNFLPLISGETRKLLSRRAFLTDFGLTQILSRVAGEWEIRYNRDQIERFPVTSEVQLALEELEHSANETRCLLRLEAGDCLVLDNRTLLHGRTEFRPNSPRLFLRARVKSSER